MALNLESEKPPSFIPQTDLRREDVVKKLIQEGRTPFLLVSNGLENFKTAVCYIPPGKFSPEQTLDLTLEEARQIASIRNKLQKLT